MCPAGGSSGQRHGELQPSLTEGSTSQQKNSTDCGGVVCIGCLPVVKCCKDATCRAEAEACPVARRRCCRWRPAAGACTGLWTNCHVASLRTLVNVHLLPKGWWCLPARCACVPVPLCPLGLKAPELLGTLLCATLLPAPAPSSARCWLVSGPSGVPHAHRGGLHQPTICWQLQVRAAVAARRAAQQGGPPGRLPACSEGTPTLRLP